LGGGEVGPSDLNGVFFKTEMYSTRAWKIDNISVWTIYHWKRLSIGFPKVYSSFKIEVEVYEIFAKCNSDFTEKSRLAATITRG